ncbi:Ig-like domain-containing protein, partial [Phaeobacter sp. CNT1-3]|nr:Ig-like domain-containing protein [Phaeobacter sp. CNT1-3]
ASVTIAGATGPGADLVVAGEGTWSVNTGTGEITFTPAAGFTGDPTAITYTVDDNDGNTSNTATVTVSYGDAPVADDDTGANPVLGSATTVDVLDGDSDADGTLDPATVTIAGATGPGADLVVAGEGTWSVNTGTGEITFTPAAGFAGDPTAITYTVDDNDGNTSNAATVTVSYADPPVATNDTVVPTGPGPVVINPLTNDTGMPPLDPTSVVLTLTGAATGATLAPDGRMLTVPGEGVWSVNASTGAVTFTPAAGFSGAPTPAAYTVADINDNRSNEATLSLSILPAIDITAIADGPFTVNGATGGTTTASLLDNDTLGGALITNTSLVNLTPVSLPTPSTGSVMVNPDGTVTVAPGTAVGIYTITYEICEIANPTNCATAEARIAALEGDSLIMGIEEDLERILEDDLVNTVTMQSHQISRYSGDALDRLRSREACLADVSDRLSQGNILFETDSAVINPQSEALLDDIAEILRSCPNNSFEIAGHTDSSASETYNIDLSQRRVEAVERAIAARGVDTSGYEARGYGESQPVASNATEADKAQNRRVEFRNLTGAAENAQSCGDRSDITRSFNLDAGESGTKADGQYRHDQHNCATDRRHIVEGSLRFTENGGQTQTAVSMSYRREQYRGSESVVGYFFGLYGSQSDISGRADGEIEGFGANAGIYGARRLQDALFLDYHLGAAIGSHDFDLAFNRTIGTVLATGDYRYVAGFAGAALSGEAQFGQMVVTPRIGFDYIYVTGADVNVMAEFGSLSEFGKLELDAISGGRLFAEMRTDHSIWNGDANLWLNPRVSCYKSLGALDGVCGFGGTLGIESTADDSDLTYTFEIDGEWGDEYSLVSLNLSVRRHIGQGILRGDAAVNSNGAVSVNASFERKF